MSTKRRTALRFSDALLGCALVVPFAATGCASDDQSKAAAGAGAGPVYALLAIVFNPDDTSTTYIVLSDTPDIDRVSLKGAREFAGRRNIAATGGHLFVGSYDEPTLSRYSFSDTLEWQDEGAISFANEGAQDARIESLVNESAAYAPFGEHDPLRIIWDPAALLIAGTRPSSTVPAEQRGLPARWGGFDFEERRGPPLRTVMYDDGDFFEIAPTTTVVAYDPVTHEEARTIEVDCPGMYLDAQDEAGNTYLASVASPALALYGQLEGSCVRRILLDGGLDETWKPDLTAWTEGRQLSNFSYVRNGRGIGSVLHHEELEALGADFSGPYDPDVYEESQQGNHYRPWLFDLERETAAPITGVEQGVSAAPMALDGRTFLNVSYDEYGRTEMYEVNADGAATARFEVPAYVESWVRVR